MSGVEGVKSELALAIERRKRKAYEFDLQGFFGLGDRPILKVAIWVATKEEQDASAIAAHRLVKEIAGELEEVVRRDQDVMGDAKVSQILFRVCRRCEPGDDERGWMYPAFPSPEWMRKNLTTDQLAVLIHLANEVRSRENPQRNVSSEEQVLGVAAICASHAATDIPEAMLASMDREALTHAFVILAIKLKQATDTKEAADGVPGEGEPVRYHFTPDGEPDGPEVLDSGDQSDPGGSG